MKISKWFMVLIIVPIFIGLSMIAMIIYENKYQNEYFANEEEHMHIAHHYLDLNTALLAVLAGADENGQDFKSGLSKLDAKIKEYIDSDEYRAELKGKSIKANAKAKELFDGIMKEDEPSLKQEKALELNGLLNECAEEFRKTKEYYHNRVIETENALNMLYAALFAAVFLLLIMATILLRRNLLAPINDLSKLTNAVSEGDFSKRIERIPHNELGALCESFNNMLDSVQLAKHKLYMTEREINTKEVFLSVLIETIPAPVYYVNEEGCLTIVNRAFENFFDIPREKVLGMDMGSINNANFEKYDSDLQKNRGEHSYETEVITSARERKSIIIHKAAVDPGAEYKQYGIIAIITDITERKELEKSLEEHKEDLELRIQQRTAELEQSNMTLKYEADARKRIAIELKKSEEKYRAINEDGGFAVALIDEGGKVVEMNKTMEELCGYRSGDELHVDDLHPDDSNGVYKRLFEDAFETGRSSMLDAQIVSSSGEVVPVDIKKTLVEYSGGRYLQSIFVDIRDRKEWEKLLTIQKDCATILADYDSMNIALNDVLRKLIQIKGMDIGVFYIRDDEDEIFELEAWVNIDNESAYELKNMRIEDLGPAAYSHMLVVPIEAFKESKFRQLLESEGVKYASIFPARRVGDTVGLLCLGSRRAIVPDERALTVIDSIASQIAGAIIRVFAEYKLKAGEKRFRAITENNTDVIMIVSKSYYIKYKSPAFFSVFGYSGDDMEAHNLFECIYEEDVVNLDRQLQQIIEEGENTGAKFELRGKRKDGQLLYLSVSVKNMTSEPSVAGLLIVAQDKTESKLAEMALRQSEERYRKLLNDINDGFYLTDKEGVLVFVNNALVRMFGASNSEELLGTKVFNLVRPDARDEMKKLFDNDVRNGEGREEGLEVPVIKLNGEVAVVLVRTGIVLNEGGDIDGTRGLVNDITEAKQNEERINNYMDELKRSNEELDKFAYVVSHDLQEPLRSVKNYIGLYKNKFSDSITEKGAEYLEKSETAAERMRGMILDLLDYSRVTTRQKPAKPISLRELIEDAIDNLRVSINEKEARINYSAEDLGSVMGDYSNIMRVFQNIISNALKYSKDDEKPVVEIDVSQDSEKIGFLKVSIKDNGIGFEAQFAERIFGVFERLHSKRKYEGTGVGLAVCKRIVEVHGGSISASSEEGKGSEFVFTLPKTEDTE